MENKLYVEVEKKLVGQLTKENDEFLFSYTSENKNAFISLTMQVRAKSYANKHLHPIFEMHLPEGYLLSIIKKHFSKIVKTDDFGLLQLMSKSIHGRLTYVHTDEIQEQFLTLEELLQPKSINLFNELVSRFALNSPLSGVQPKVLARVQDKATLKLDDYIVKSWGDDYPQLALNEYYCMSIAKYAGIDVADFYISDDDKLFIMKRFDIQEDGTTLGFEDMCVLQAKQREDKYEGSYEQIAKSIKIFVSPEHKRASLQAFFKIIIINNLVQNGDAHLKNFGLIYKNITDIKLAPAYDIVSTTVYIKNDIPALTLLGSKKWWDKKYLLRFGVEFCELSKSDVLALYEECLHALEIVKNEIDVRIQRENNEVKAKLLENLLKTFSLEKN
ncbi:MAG: type II toxin-antitoxin system HipA family toxin [Sulfurimonas sp.]|nr:type II toxin-antitoxin system HipA family toxin [Sulfurimonas sp.]MBU3938248.1 type II toxin-antitoxin system HipA family toxin [bacterium]MBU4024248.1 type II toxin-antitoxin system HipA family toxin [bacterium]MBU4058921.1 type II toxin-antitoxin system HipA family toxin [bacterium]